MKKKTIAKLENLLSSIKAIANKTFYPFADDDERLRWILQLIEGYDHETLA